MKTIKIATLTELENITDFKAWGGAVDTLDFIRENNLELEATDYIKQFISDFSQYTADEDEAIVSDTALNDYLWFDEELHNFLRYQ